VIRSGFDGQRFIAYCDKDTERKNFVKEYAAGGNVLVMIGPEGDFSAEEVALSLANGFQPVTFGESRLRTETAGIFACAAVHSKIQMTKL
ncbi:MAG: RsmE family RNA methyltransferase, partial [Candidatus Limisoma sp.]|nr:RsmE family RNA methyltransferase [Candidatus Limisoma sp.]